MWTLLALAASFFWGFTYVINEQLYKHISVLSAVIFSLLGSGIILAIVGWSTGILAKDFATVAQSQRALVLLVCGILTLTIAELLIGLSIQEKNATVAGLIEISYPVFIVIAGYLIFKETHLSLATAIGGGLIFFGVGIIYAFNR